MLSVEQLTFSYDKKPVLNDISFKLKAGEHLAIIGESGCGKSTLLKLLYGEYDLNGGHIYWKDQEILGPKFNLVVGYDFMKYVAQEFDLMPFISVEENIGKFLSNFYPEEKKARTAELLEVVELTAFAKTKVKILSGGQKQRVALARALAKQPEIMLLDEPFSHIDNFKKQSLRRNVFKYLKEKNISCVVATHDKEDVLGFADHMIVLNNNKIVESNSPEKLFKSPKTSLIASFFGEFNTINGEIIYAHQLKVVESSKWQATVKHVYFKGHFYLVEAVLNNQTVFFEHDNALNPYEEVHIAMIK
ncbi:ABC transporter ATP-binding protein [Tamlana sp. 2_MG-2023]|uniref:ABC transporter ATP-binding protein n=1 Tax=unclassified Tamlana TaxID=2614803 RepID=UPI0026E201CF|nr:MULTISPECIES: ABC transporter ATP-binding protein [unclassified Tamlana]MDO6759636.1 ABC transporter ATP-binding protein [Tamlana sp. 2_MG-2023]MDO6791259.1 ABC transporter ATP-binding protein [Tamlana sp. 1_MG-2023]